MTLDGFARRILKGLQVGIMRALAERLPGLAPTAIPQIHRPVQKRLAQPLMIGTYAELPSFSQALPWR